MRKILFAGIELTPRRVRGLRGTSELPGRPAVVGEKTIYKLYCIVSKYLYISSIFIGDLSFGKDYTSLEFGPDLKVFRGHRHQGKLLCTSIIYVKNRTPSTTFLYVSMVLLSTLVLYS